MGFSLSLTLSMSLTIKQISFFCFCCDVCLCVSCVCLFGINHKLDIFQENTTLLTTTKQSFLEVNQIQTVIMFFVPKATWFKDEVPLLGALDFDEKQELNFYANCQFHCQYHHYQRHSVRFLKKTKHPNDLDPRILNSPR